MLKLHVIRHALLSGPLIHSAQQLFLDRTARLQLRKAQFPYRIKLQLTAALWILTAIMFQGVLVRLIFCMDTGEISEIFCYVDWHCVMIECNKSTSCSLQRKQYTRTVNYKKQANTSQVKSARFDMVQACKTNKQTNKETNKQNIYVCLCSGKVIIYTMHCLVPLLTG